MSITTNTSTSRASGAATGQGPIRISRGSRPGWGQTAVRFRAEVATTTFPRHEVASGPPATPGASNGCEQLTLFDTAPYAKAVKR